MANASLVTRAYEESFAFKHKDYTAASDNPNAVGLSLHTKEKYRDGPRNPDCPKHSLAQKRFVVWTIVFASGIPVFPARHDRPPCPLS